MYKGDDIMKDFLIKEWEKQSGRKFDREIYDVQYFEDINEDVDDKDTWLERGTSFIYKVCSLSFTDSNKCDFAHVILGMQRNKDSEPIYCGYLYFKQGENDDPGSVLTRWRYGLSVNHPVFE
jgi:hypothetical protein